MKKTLIFCFLYALFLNPKAQNTLKEYTSTLLETRSLTKEAQSEFARRNELLKKPERTDYEEAELQVLLEMYEEQYATIWDIDGAGCSWYCDGGNYKVEASSALSGQSGNSYDAAAANDLSYQTAWVEGKRGNGIGEYIEYHFRNKSPRVTSVIISNGYVKSKLAWYNNNRVKTLKMYINGEALGLLYLKDEKADQKFDVGTLGRNEDGSDLVLRFEIREVYKGAKYEDTAITEIYFDGIDVH